MAFLQPNRRNQTEPLPDSGLKDLVILRRRRLSRLTLDRIMGQRDGACPLAVFFHNSSSTQVFPKSWL